MSDFINPEIDPELEKMARELRLERDQELSELEEIEEEVREHEIDLPFALLELLWRGDSIRAQVYDRSFIGNVIHVGDDIVTILTTSNTEVDCNLAHLNNIIVTERMKEGGRAKAAADPQRFVSRLRELADYVALEAEFGGPQLSVVGRIAQVHNDHIRVIAKDRKEWIIPLYAIAYVIRSRETRR